MTKLVGISRGEEIKGSLQRQHAQLQRDLDTYKQSALPWRQCRASVIVELFDGSPKQQPSSLRGDESPDTEVWGVRSVDWDAEEIMLERKAVTKSGGRLSGRSLLEALEGARDDPDADDAGQSGKGGASSGSACPSALTHGRGDSPARSLSSCGCSCSACSSCRSSYVVKHVGGHQSSSASSLSLERVEGEKVMGARGGEDGGVAGDEEGRRMVGMAWLAVVLMMFSLGVIFLTDLLMEEDGGCMIAT